MMEGVGELLRSHRANNTTGYRGVHQSCQAGRFQARCDTSRCQNNYLGTFDTSAEAAHAYLQHWKKEHPEELAREPVPRPVLLAPPVIQTQQGHHLVVWTEHGRTSYNGIHLHCSRYQAKCDAPPCANNHLGYFDTLEVAARTYQQHWLQDHMEESERNDQVAEDDPVPVMSTKTCVELMEKQKKRKLSGSNEEEVCILIKSSTNKTGYRGVILNGGRYQARCDTRPCYHENLGTFGNPKEAAQMYLLHWKNEHPAELEKVRRTHPELRPVQEQPVKSKSANLAGYNGALAQTPSSSCRLLSSRVFFRCVVCFRVPER
jgi:hypothetical protein